MSNGVLTDSGFSPRPGPVSATAMEYNRLYAGQDHITLPYTATEDDDIIAAVLHGAR